MPPSAEKKEATAAGQGDALPGNEVMLHPKAAEALGNGEQVHYDPEQSTEKLKYPKSVFFIVGNEFCERFSYYGMKAILILYLTRQLKFDEDTSTVIYHIFNIMCYFTPVLGALIADSWLGRFKTIFYISIIYCIGNAVVSISAIGPIFTDLTTEKVICFIGLFLIAFGTGGIKPCVSAFGGDQFVVPQQEKQLAQFFFVFYASVNAGSLISTILTPILRDDVKCFGTDCYSLAFGVPAILMVVALMIFLGGRVTGLYKMKPPQGSILRDVVGCVWTGIKRKWQGRRQAKKEEHWLDYAKEDCGEELVADVKVLVKILLLYLPLPVFWALYDQQGSRWTLQATHMDGEMGSITIKPDQMGVVNPILILLMIPVFDRGVYPLLGYCNLLKRQLPRMFAGGVLAAVAFIVSGFLEMQLEKTYPVAINHAHSRVTFINTLHCQVNVTPSWDNTTAMIQPFASYLGKDVSLKDEDGMYIGSFSVEVKFDTGNCGDVHESAGSYIVDTLTNETAHVLMVTAGTGIDSGTAMLEDVGPDVIDKPSNGLPNLRMLYNVYEDTQLNESNIHLHGNVESYTFSFKNSSAGYISGTEYQELEPDTYKVILRPSNQTLGEITVKLGGVYDFLLQKKNDSETESYEAVKLYQVTEPNTIHMMWLLPQYFIITASEIMFAITGLEFSFSQAPATMKSVLQAAWLLGDSFGNVIIVIIAEAKIFERQSMEFFLFAVIMFVDMILFAFIASRYKYVDEIKAEKDSMEITEKEGNINEGFSKDEHKF